MADQGWIGVDLDGTLAFYTKFEGPTVIGEPIPAMLERVKGWIKAGHAVKIFTARVSSRNPLEVAAVRKAIQSWCIKHGLPPLEVTCIKDYHMVTLWDDRAVHVIPNTGKPLGHCRGTGFSSY